MSERATTLHANPWHGVFYLTGGGSLFLAELMSTPGASNTVLEARIPYAASALTNILGGTVEQAASNATAKQLAMAAFERAVELAAPNADLKTLFGLGCTASLGTNRVKKGAHRAHWAVQTATATFAFDTTYNGDRASEENLLNDQLWDSLSFALTGSQLQSKSVDVQHAQPREHIAALLAHSPHRYCPVEHDGRLLLPGSFNPLHDGHRQMLAIGESMTGLSGAYELSIRNADKPNLDFITVEERLAGIEDNPVWLSNTPTFAGKAEIFPGATFLLGVDTLARLGELRFYHHRGDLMEAAMHSFARYDCHFIVFGRKSGDTFLTLRDLNLPAELRNRCTPVSEDAFRADISSTVIRRRRS